MLTKGFIEFFLYLAVLCHAYPISTGHFNKIARLSVIGLLICTFVTYLHSLNKASYSAILRNFGVVQYYYKKNQVGAIVLINSSK